MNAISSAVLWVDCFACLYCSVVSNANVLAVTQEDGVHATHCGVDCEDMGVAVMIRHYAKNRFKHDAQDILSYNETNTTSYHMHKRRRKRKQVITCTSGAERGARESPQKRLTISTTSISNKQTASNSESMKHAYSVRQATYLYYCEGVSTQLLNYC